MKYYPIFLDVKNRPCMVVGGGRVATRKVQTLLDCGAKVTVVSPLVTAQLGELVRQNKIELRQRTYASEDMDGIFLVIGATDDEALNQKIHREAEQKGLLCNIADQPHLCNFILPSLVNQGDLTVAISTAGKSPAFAKHLRRHLQAHFGPEYGLFLNLMGAIRSRLLKAGHAPEMHKPLFEQLITRGLLDLIKADDRKGVDELLASVLGREFTYEKLIDNQ